MFYNSYFLPSIDYCITTWDYVSKENVERVFKYQKRLGRMILHDYECSTKILFERLGWLTVSERIEFQTLNLVYKCIHENVPLSLVNMFNVRTNIRELL